MTALIDELVNCCAKTKTTLVYIFFKVTESQENNRGSCTKLMTKLR